ncbi:urea ABC transporter permease subunit UrtB [Bordetella genomosp. 13]|uniref:Urea ABC transporter permease subunit UrtB n=1 Tax=Bordetella genomosp. 13 TaxID=463040 RepID=A0A1W6Z9B4_9BORD|nr:urea ABC transporter permease subunit UrtB [Bordetella genomosp. 13]ARP93929.1 urea ABC transporter permease subunit UrtB [Bordetella genomosp. 13]
MRLAAISGRLGRFVLGCALGLAALSAGAGAEGLDPAMLAPLAGDDTDAKLQAINGLGRLPEPRAAEVLQALGAGQLLATPAGRVLIEREGGQALDPATGEALAQPDDADAVMINNRLRRAISAALATSQLYSKQSAERLAAAQRLQQSSDASRLPLLAQALKRENDPQVRSALEVAQARLQLASDDPAVRRAAAQALGETRNAAFRPLLAALIQRNTDGSHAEPDAGVREAAEAALRAIDRHMATLEWTGNLFYGISLGSVLLLAALGLAITFGLMGVINMAHGELLMIGAYATYVVQTVFRQWLPGWVDWYVLAALPVAFVVTAAVGMALERTVIRWLYGRPLETLLATWGISLMLMQGVRTLFGAQNVEVGNPSWMSGGVTVLGGLVLAYNRIAIIVFALLVVFFVWLLLNHTRLGLFVRAITQNRRMADCVGVPTGRIDMLAFGLGSGIAGLAGVALSQLGNVGPDLGRGYIVDSFMVVVLGGVGQLAGTVIAALGLGGVNKFLEPYAGAVMAKITILILIVLFVQKRPQGLFAPRGRSVE